MQKLLTAALVLFFAVNVKAEICGDLRSELFEAIRKVPSPGGQLFIALPDGKTCTLSVGIFEISAAVLRA